MAGSQDYEDQAAFLTQFLWSPEFSPKTVAETFKTQLPVIAKVTSGYDGCDGMHEFAMDEVYCIVDIKKQKRVVMTDTKDRYISIPFDYHVKFHTVGSNNKPEGAARPLSEICPSDSSSLNVNLRVMFEENQAVRFNEGADLGSKIKLGVLEYDEVYKERYLVCHPLQNNEILADVVLIPIYVPISLSLAEGFVGGSAEAFSGWMRCIAASVKAFDTRSIQPCTEIVVFEESPASDYTYINPLNLFQHTLKTSPRDPEEDLKRYMNITQCKEKQKGRLGAFGALHLPELGQGPAQNNKTMNQHPEQTASQGPALPPRNYTKEPSPEKSSSPQVPLSSRKISGSSTGEVTSPVTSPSTPAVRQGTSVPKTTAPPSPLKSRSDVTNPAKRPQPPIPEKETVTGNATRFFKNVEDPAKESSRVKATIAGSKKSEPSKPSQDYKGVDSTCSNARVGFSHDKLIKDCPPLIKNCPPFSKDSSQQSNVCPQQTNVYAQQRSSSSKSSVCPQQSSVCPQQGSVCPQQSNVCPQQGSVCPEHTTVCPELVEYETLNELVVTPKIPDDKALEISSGSGWKSLDDKVAKPSDFVSWKCIDNVPADLNIRLLSVDELCRCLELLEMGKFVAQFRQKMVDGCLLLALPNESLRQDFGMSLLEATKLMKFARDGWRPKIQ